MNLGNLFEIILNFIMLPWKNSGFWYHQYPKATLFLIASAFTLGSYIQVKITRFLTNEQMLNLILRYALQYEWYQYWFFKLRNTIFLLHQFKYNLSLIQQQLLRKYNIINRDHISNLPVKFTFNKVTFNFYRTCLIITD